MNLAEEALAPGRAPEAGGRVAFHTKRGPVTNAVFQALVGRISAGLAARGIRPGDRVLLRMGNSVEFAASFLAVIRLGATPALQNSQFGSRELAHIINLTRPALVLSGEDQWRSDAVDLFAGVPRVLVTRAGLHDADGAPLAAEPPPPPHEARPDDPAFIVFTSGTTGQPKGIVHAHRWLSALGDANRRRIPPRPDDVALATGEWSFVSALGHNVLFPLRNGIAASILEERPTPERILATIARDGVTLLYSVATLYRRILGTAGIERKYDLSRLRGANSTGEPLEASVRAEWEARFGCPLWEHYGVSEIQMVLGVGPERPTREGAVGVSWGARPAILGEDDEPLPAGSVGTLAFDASYPGLFLGYLGDEARTKAAKRNGWYVTTDLARMDEDGYVYILGRADDCFKSKGVLIAPREIEEALLGLGTIEEACVFPIPDAEIGHRIGAAIVPRAGTGAAELDAEAIAKALAGRIARFKCPHVVVVMEALPKNVNGKTQRSEIARMALAGNARERRPQLEAIVARPTP